MPGMVVIAQTNITYAYAPAPTNLAPTGPQLGLQTAASLDAYDAVRMGKVQRTNTHRLAVTVPMIWHVQCPRCGANLNQVALEMKSTGGSTTLQWVSLLFLCETPQADGKPCGEIFWTSSEIPTVPIPKATLLNPGVAPAPTAPVPSQKPGAGLRLPAPRVPNRQMDAEAERVYVGFFTDMAPSISITLTNAIDEPVVDIWSGATIPADPDLCCDTNGFAINSTGTIAVVCWTGPCYKLLGTGNVECSHDLSNWFKFPDKWFQVNLDYGNYFVNPVSSVNQYFRTVQ